MTNSSVTPSAVNSHTVSSQQSAVIRIGTRNSKLALWQTNHVAELLQSRHEQVHCELVPVVTQGDRRLDRPLPEIGGKGLFTAELEQALLGGEIDLAVHSLKDLPVENTPGLTLGAIVSREDVRDVLVAAAGATLATLPSGAIIGTSSLRRQAQLFAYRPDLQVRSIRGNVDTRIRKVLEGDYDAAVLAGAGLHRLGLGHHAVEWLSLAVMLPAPGQGALAVQCRADDVETRDLLAAIDDRAVRTATYTERRLLWLLGGGCSAPVAAYATWSAEDNTFTLAARAGAIDGSAIYDVQVHGGSADAVAVEAASKLLALGAGSVLGGSRDSAERRSLAGLRVVITRGQEQADELGLRLQATGAIPILAPAIAIRPVADQSRLENAFEHLSTYSWIVFTSVNAVDQFVSTLKAYAGLRALGELGGELSPRVAAVGPATEMALQLQGIPVSYMPRQQTGEALAAGLPFEPGARILLPRAAIGKATLPERLAARGAVPDDIAIYTTEPAPLSLPVLEQLRQGFEAVTFTSGSTAKAFCTALRDEPALAEQLAQSIIVCIGPSTAAVVAELGLAPHVIADDHSIPGLVNALAGYVARRA
jgi:hydroxymethylbilane synthase